jgi:ABC-2 type transport system permease protein
MKTLRDTGIVFGRSFGQTVRNPVWVFVTLMQPLFYLFLFAPLLKKVTTAQGFPEGGAYNVFVPGLLVQLALFGTIFVGFTIIAEVRYGVIERLQVTPISRAALLLGRVLRDLVALAVQIVIIIVVAIPFGLDVSLGNALIGLALFVLIGVTFSSLSYTLGLKLKTEDALAPFLNAVVLPCCCSRASSCRWPSRRSGCSASPTSIRCRTWSTPAGPSSTAISAAEWSFEARSSASS